MDDIRLEGNEATFSINTQDPDSGESYMGDFRCKCILNPLDDIKANRLYRSLLGEHAYTASDRAKNASFALSQLQARLIKFPEFWKNSDINGGHIPYAVLMVVLDKAISAQEKYKEEKKKEQEEIENMLYEKIKSKEIKEKEKITIKDKEYEVNE